jgi:putative FmdB family regulatory protein
MPIYDYHCEQCQAEFEKLVLGSAPVTCPSCRSRDVTRLLPSRFGVQSGGRFLASAPAGCGSCRASSCAGCASAG